MIDFKFHSSEIFNRIGQEKMDEYKTHKMSSPFKRSFGNVRRPRMMGMGGGMANVRSAPFARAARKAYLKRNRKRLMS